MEKSFHTAARHPGAQYTMSAGQAPDVRVVDVRTQRVSVSAVSAPAAATSTPAASPKKRRPRPPAADAETLNLAQAAVEWGASAKTLGRIIQRGELPCFYKLTRQWRVRIEDLKRAKLARSYRVQPGGPDVTAHIAAAAGDP